LKVPEAVEWIPVSTTEEMRGAVLDQAAHANIIIMAAAVADYRPAAAQTTKLKRTTDHLTLELEPTPDILAELGRDHAPSILIGFAAETDNIAENAQAKLARKGADMIVANDVTQEGAGFDADTNIVTLFLRDGRHIPLPKMSKLEVANRILDQALQIAKP
jgi:phosphopantothenoylcysteine decarboxylase/phosphopantothenate--cysteine ligase